VDHFCIPPDTDKSSPVTNDDASLIRYTTGPTTSRGSAMRFWNVPLATSSRKPGAVRAPPSIISLMNGPGDRAFTRIFHGAHSIAMLFVRFTRAPFDAAYAL